ncbi:MULTISPECIES: DUF1990 family protein [unclassified Leifsonia]|uniref:DUF1990 family protein n=1 Tax=unclassified Leifsonia TaxID=2663824 RepID=UPI0006FB946E|nr:MULTISPECIES: DUF1990 domain-containing protein [unclassified Leifsonia]KQX07101.1 hypothetical protein ASC59_04650 [Leifsonia sp. Root1293]KRA11384.1 hypothetical protein ASD61_04650 [Leifsonia sp. Root60]
MRRSTFVGEPVTYGAIGGTLAPDLLAYPPAGYRAEEHTVRLGSGSERFSIASSSLMTWGVQRGSGIEVTEVRSGTGTQYTGLVFNDDGTPAAEQPALQAEERYGPDGSPFITAGMTAKLKLHMWRLTFTAPVRVIYVIDEPGRVGFAYGTMPGHPESGEEAWVVEHRDDDSVWLTIRSFSRPSTAFYKLAAPVLRSVQKRYTKRYLRALHPVAAAA